MVNSILNWKKTMTVACALTLLLLLPCLPPENSIQADKRDKIKSYNYSTAAPIQTTSTIHHSGLPKVDEIIFKAYPSALPDTIVQEFIDGVTDWIEGPSISDLHDMVTTAGHKVSTMDPAAEFGSLMINCRDYKERSGKPNFPLNDKNFRVALSYIYGMDRKQTDIYNYYGVDWEYAIGNPVPPAQEPWYNESIQMPDTNWTKAWNILQSAGYYINSTENWLYQNGTKIRNMTVTYGGGLFWPRGPGGGFVEAFNEFITTHLNANGPTMEIRPQDFMTFIYDLVVYHDFDFVCIGFTNLGRYVDWLYNFLHSDNIGYWGWNFGGIRDPDLDKWLMIILTSINVQKIIEAASKVQGKLVNELMPWIPVSSGKKFCTTARDERGELTNVVSMPNSGPMNAWSYMTIHWKGEPNVTWPGGTVTVAMGDEPYTLNPWNEVSRYGWEMLDRSIVGLTIVEPENLMNMPFVRYVAGRLPRDCLRLRRQHESHESLSSWKILKHLGTPCVRRS